MATATGAVDAMINPRPITTLSGDPQPQKRRTTRGPGGQTQIRDPVIIASSKGGAGPRWRTVISADLGQKSGVWTRVAGELDRPMSGTPLRPVVSGLTKKFSPGRRRIYLLLIATPGRAWTVGEFVLALARLAPTSPELV